MLLLRTNHCKGEDKSTIPVFGCLAQTALARLDTDWIQTGYRLDTNWIQAGYRLDTDWIQLEWSKLFY